MKIEDLKVGRVYRAKRPRGAHRLDGSYVNDRQTELITICFEIKSTVSDFKSPNGHNLVGDVNYYVMPSDTFKQLEKLGLLDEVPPHIGFITAHEGRYSKFKKSSNEGYTCC